MLHKRVGLAFACWLGLVTTARAQPPLKMNSFGQARVMNITIQ